MVELRSAVNIFLLLVVACCFDGAYACECSIGYSPFVTRAMCNDKGLQAIPECVPVNTTELYFSYNSLTELDSSDLAPFPFLKKMTVTDNGLQKVNPETFFYVRNLEEFDAIRNQLQTLPSELFTYTPNIMNINLAMNKLTSIPSLLFRNNPTLRSLRLFTNYLTELDSEQFAYNPQLKEIYLSGNLLTTLPAGLFANNAILEYIDLARNRLTQISFDLFVNTIPTNIYLNENQITTVENAFSLFTIDRLKVLALSQNNLTKIDFQGQSASESFVESIWLHDNPWYCDCKLKETYSVISTHYAEYLEIPTCAAPELLSGSTWREAFPQLSCQS